MDFPQGSQCYSNESINVMEPGQRIPCKKRYAQRTIRFDARGNQVDIKDSDSDDDHKMPAKNSCKKPKKVANPMNTESSEETDDNEDFKARKEEKAFLKSIDKKENSDTSGGKNRSRSVVGNTFHPSFVCTSETKSNTAVNTTVGGVGQNKKS
jgi:hypothetical protein